MKKLFSILSLAILVGCVSAPTANAPDESLETKIAARHRILTSDSWGGGHRIIFDFNGRRGWVVEPPVGTAVSKGSPWVWTMQWMGAFIQRTAAPYLVQKGWRHVHLEAFDTRCNEEGLKALSEFQDYLVNDLGFAPKAKLIGMSWGGFYSVRYAKAFPEKVAKIYLDAPLLNFEGFGGDAMKTPTAAAAQIGPWAQSIPEKGWSDDPRMPVNMASALAKAGIPVYLLYGGQDQTVNPKLNSERFIPAFKEAGGNLKVEKRGLFGHHPHGLDHHELGKLIDFFAKED